MSKPPNELPTQRNGESSAKQRDANCENIFLILPYEVLEIIFVHCQQIEFRAEPFAYNRRPIENRLLFVCKHLHETTLQNPRLWTTFVVNTQKKNSCERVVTYVSRAGIALPLHVGVDIPFMFERVRSSLGVLYGSTEMLYPEALDLVRNLLLTVERIETLRIRCDDQDFLAFATIPLHCTSPSRLKELHVVIEPAHYNDDLAVVDHWTAPDSDDWDHDDWTLLNDVGPDVPLDKEELGTLELDVFTLLRVGIAISSKLHPETTLSFDDLQKGFRSFCHAPSLETVVLQNVLFEEDATVPILHKPTSLRLIRKGQYEGFDPTMNMVLPHFNDKTRFLTMSTDLFGQQSDSILLTCEELQELILLPSGRSMGGHGFWDSLDEKEDFYISPESTAPHVLRVLRAPNIHTLACFCNKEPLLRDGPDGLLFQLTLMYNGETFPRLEKLVLLGRSRTAVWMSPYRGWADWIREYIDEPPSNIVQRRIANVASRLFPDLTELVIINYFEAPDLHALLGSNSVDLEGTIPPIICWPKLTTITLAIDHTPNSQKLPLSLLLSLIQTRARLGNLSQVNLIATKESLAKCVWPGWWGPEKYIEKMREYVAVEVYDDPQAYDRLMEKFS